MNLLFSKYWWLFLIRGLIAVLIGTLALIMPVSAFTGLVVLLGAYMLVDGLYSVIAAGSERGEFRNWTGLLISGIVGVLAGIITFTNPFATGTALVYLFAFWMLMVGCVEVGVAIRLRQQIRGEGWYILTGVLTILFSLFVFFNPIAGAVFLVVVFGIYMLIAGILFIALAVRLRNRYQNIVSIR